MVFATLLLIKRLTEAASVQRIDNLAKDADAPPMPLPEGVAALRLRSALFFSVVDRLEAGFGSLPLRAETSPIMLDFLEVIYLHSIALEAIRRFGDTCRKSGIDVIIFGLGEQPRSLFARTGADHEFGLDHVVETRRQALDLVSWRRVTSQIRQ